MSVLGRLASSLQRRDELPNLELAKSLAEEGNEKAVMELVENLDNKDRDIRNDCIKVLYEIGERRPALIANHSEKFVDLLNSKDNRLVWGAMTALDAMALERPEAIQKVLPALIAAADRGSVITRDHAVGILIKLSSIKAYENQASNLLMKQLAKCPTNQLPMYAEMLVSAVPEGKRSTLARALATRVRSIDKESKRRRVEKVIRKLKGPPK